jgi:superfamily II DNA/RNA helicase
VVALHKDHHNLTATKTFTDLGLDPVLNDALAAKGITHPFPIQELTLPLAFKGADLIGQARTGTGKTLAFGLPLLQRIDPSKKKTQALVVVPTRELCLQVADDLEIGRTSGITSIAVYGGVGYDEQIDALRGGVHVVVGTPGRTLDHLQRGNLDLSEVHVVVLDEADEMLDMGFLPDVERLLSGISNDRQTMLFSATMPTAIVKLARRFMDQPTFMRADAELHETAPTVEQYFFLVHRMDKPRVLARILQTDNRGGAFVFTRTKNMADRLVRELDELNVRAIAVHGDLRQATREKNMDRFREGKADVLVATEVAARGLDVDNVTHVVNYDCPDDEKMYLHRIGRTARAGATGVAVTFAEFNEVDRVNVIRKAVGSDVELKEIFSTSDDLTAMFDLPDDTPWGHLSSTRSSSGRSATTPSRSTAASDGRSRNRTPARDRASGGSETSDKTRKDQPARAARTPKPTPTPKPTRERASSGTAETERTRTRTRERTKTAQAVKEAVDAAGSDTSGSGAVPRTRTRARSGSSDTPSKSGQARTSRSSGSSARTRSGDDNASTADSKRTSSKKSSSRSNGAKKASDDRGRRRGSDDGGASPRHGSTRATATTRRGEQARGDGTPRFSRRVEVEHLP